MMPRCPNPSVWMDYIGTTAHASAFAKIQTMTKPCSSMAEFASTAALAEQLYHVWKNLAAPGSKLAIGLSHILNMTSALTT